MSMFKEVEHHGAKADAIHRLRQEIEPFLSELIHLLHDERAMDAGEMWTIPIGLSCGFEGAVVVYITNPGPVHPRLAAKR